jgi:hypothetical protein
VVAGVTTQEAQEHPRFRRIMRWGNVAAWVTLVAIVGVIAYQYTQLQDVVDDTHAGGCALQTDLQQRAENTLDFVAAHPHFNAFGVTAGTLRVQAQSQLRTAETLNRLHC